MLMVLGVPFTALVLLMVLFWFGSSHFVYCCMCHHATAATADRGRADRCGATVALSGAACWLYPRPGTHSPLKSGGKSQHHIVNAHIYIGCTPHWAQMCKMPSTCSAHVPSHCTVTCGAVASITTQPV